MIPDRMTLEVFETLPLLIRGESKEIRNAGEMDGVRYCWIRLLPTIYSFSANRTGIVDGSDLLRYQATEKLVQVLTAQDIDHAYVKFQDGFILSKWIDEAPNVETIVKAFHSGTSKHRYFGMAGLPVRKGCLHEGESFQDMGAYPHTIVRFDWRNPMYHPSTGERLADEAMPEDIADWWIDTRVARRTALRAFAALQDFLTPKGIVIYDLCLFISTDGRTVFGEISQDCGRFRHFNYGELDKDVWRAGGSSDQVLEKWGLFVQMLES